MNRTAWGKRNFYCFLCGDTRDLETHEMVRGVFRSEAVKAPCTWLRACHRCHHDKLHGTSTCWTYVRQLAVKLIHDPDHYDRQRCNEIYSLREKDHERVTEREVAKALQVMLRQHEIVGPQ